MAISENCGYILSPVYDTVPGFGLALIIKRYSMSTDGLPVMSIDPPATIPCFQYFAGIVWRNGRTFAYGDWSGEDKEITL